MPIEWNKNQLRIAQKVLEFPELESKQIVGKFGFARASVDNVKAALDKGEVPPSLEEEYIESAPEPTVINTRRGDGSNGKKNTGKMPSTAVASQTAYLQLVPQVQQVILTPGMFMSYMCAVKRGFTGTIGDWLDLVADDFWSGRAINFYEEVSSIGAT